MQHSNRDIKCNPAWGGRGKSGLIKDSFLTSCTEGISIILQQQDSIIPLQILACCFKYQFHSDTNCNCWFVSFDYKPIYTINNASLPNQLNDVFLPHGNNGVSKQLIAVTSYVKSVALTAERDNVCGVPKAMIKQISSLNALFT